MGISASEGERRAFAVFCREEDAARRRFAVVDDGVRIVYTRTGRRFFADTALEAGLVARLQAAVGAAGIWAELKTDWVCLDAELMPWSAKAQELLRFQYAAVGAAARSAFAEAVPALARAGERGQAVELLAHYREREALATKYVDAYRRYCWDVASVTDLKLAPFHLLASAGAVHTGRDHAWHMETLARICAADPEVLLATTHRVVDVTDPEAQDDAVRWWEEHTERGGEGMVVKPLDFIARGRRGIVQPAVKCRGREYLRIIYGPELHGAVQPGAPPPARPLAQALARPPRVRAGDRGPGAHRPRRAPRRVHECVFAVLALESERVDPRL